MTTFDEREEGFEKKYALDKELTFKAAARRNKLLGVWAAARLGLSGTEAEAYATSIVVAALGKGGDADVVAKLREDFAAGSVDQSEIQIRRMMEELMATAIEQIKSGNS